LNIKENMYLVYNDKYTMETGVALAGLLKCECGPEFKPCDILIRWGNSYEEGNGKLFDVNYNKGIRMLSTNRKGLPLEIPRVSVRELNPDKLYIAHQKYHMNGVGHLVFFGFQKNLLSGLEIKFITEYIPNNKEYRMIVDRYGNSMFQEKRWTNKWDNPASLLIKTGLNGWKYEFVDFKDENIIPKFSEYIKSLDLTVASFDIVYASNNNSYCVEGNSSPCLSNAKAVNFVYNAIKKYIREKLDAGIPTA